MARLSLGSPLRAGRYPSRAGDHELHESVQTPCRRHRNPNEIKKLGLSCQDHLPGSLLISQCAIGALSICSEALLRIQHAAI